MTKRIYQFLLLILFAISLDSQSSGGKNKLYLSKINVMAGVPDVIRNSIVNRIKLNVIEKFGDKYYIVSDSDVALMNQKAAQLQMQGCSDEVCMKQIADAIDADEIVYGDVLKEGEKIKFQFTNINRDKNTFSMTTKSIAEIAFFESQYDHFVREATFKLIDPKYKINLNVEIKSDDTISVKTINLGKVDGLDIAIMDFKSNDITIINILDYLKEEVKKGDELYNKKEYGNAFAIYQGVLDRISNSITKDKRAKIKEFEKSIIDRIGSTHIMDTKVQIDSYDWELSQLNTLSEEKIRQILKGFNGIKEFIKRDLEVQYQYRFINIEKGVNERIDILELALTRFLEYKGDTYYKENQFDQTFKAYTEAIILLESQRDQKIEFIQRLQKK